MPKTIFISYSHDNPEHMKWVKKFADDLKEKGNLNVLIDQDLPKGMSLTRFMEIGIEIADRVLVIGTETYKVKSSSNSGVAFEESIISTDVLNDIDTTKYYPILRSGTFKTSFPSILSGRNGDDIRDDSKYEDVLKVIIDEINNPKDFILHELNHYKRKNDISESVLNVVFGVKILIETMFGKPTGKIEGIAFYVDITNLCKEPRYINSPYFELSIPYDDFKNFYLTNIIGERYKFPLKLEYGQVLTQTYRLNKENTILFKNILLKHPEITIQAVCSTTLNEQEYSKPYEFKKILELLK